MAVIPAPSGCRYVALSYVWGDIGTEHCTTKDNIAERSTPGGLNTANLLRPSLIRFDSFDNLVNVTYGSTLYASFRMIRRTNSLRYILGIWSTACLMSQSSLLAVRWLETLSQDADHELGRYHSILRLFKDFRKLPCPHGIRAVGPFKRAYSPAEGYTSLGSKSTLSVNVILSAKTSPPKASCWRRSAN